jgi:hypothetical protein
MRSPPQISEQVFDCPQHADSSSGDGHFQATGHFRHGTFDGARPGDGHFPPQQFCRQHRCAQRNL